MDGVKEKFKKYADYSINLFSKDHIDKMVKILYNLEQLEDVTELTQLLAPNP